MTYRGLVLLLYGRQVRHFSGAIISFTSAKNNSTLAKQLVLERNITNLEREFKKSSSVSVLKKLDTARSALDQLLTQKVETAIFYAKHRLFESGNKPGRLLARLAQGEKGSYAIPSLKDKKGVLQFEAKLFSKIMKEFYQDLYSPECQNTVDARKLFLDILISLYYQKKVD